MSLGYIVEDRQESPKQAEWFDFAGGWCNLYGNQSGKYGVF